MPKLRSYDIYVTTVVEVRDAGTKMPAVKLSTTAQSETFHDGGLPMPTRVAKALAESSGDAVNMIGSYAQRGKI